MGNEVNSRTYRLLGGVDRAIEAGREEGYPECCVAFFAEVWAPLRLSGIPRPSVADGVLSSYAERIDAAGLPEGFIPCPACLRAAEQVRVVSLAIRRPGAAKGGA
jgi:hypothetical protein